MFPFFCIKAHTRTYSVHVYKLSSFESITGFNPSSNITRSLFFYHDSRNGVERALCVGNNDLIKALIHTQFESRNHTTSAKSQKSLRTVWRIVQPVSQSPCTSEVPLTANHRTPASEACWMSCGARFARRKSCRWQCASKRGSRAIRRLSGPLRWINFRRVFRTFEICSYDIHPAGTAEPGRNHARMCTHRTDNQDFRL